MKSGDFFDDELVTRMEYSGRSAVLKGSDSQISGFGGRGEERGRWGGGN